jgi:hypothetical protein
MVNELKKLSLETRKDLIIRLLQEQVLEQRDKLRFWRDLTNQAAQIDTGYIGQHLVSLITSVPGSSMRGKGDDLEDGSEVKSANFIDSLDKKGAVAPRWNFSSNDLASMESYLNCPHIYLVSVDFNKNNLFRARVWKIEPKKHKVLFSRYHEWMDKLGIPKLSNPNRPGVNFQLFPPRFKTDESFARHGNGRSNGFEPIKVELEGVPGAKKILHVEEKNSQIEVIFLDAN